MQEYKIQTSRIRALIAILAGGAMTSLPSLLNGFPFLYYDSGLYLGVATRPNFSMELIRSYVYSLLLVPLIIFKSLLFAVCLQNLLLVAILYYFYRVFASHAPLRYFFVVLVILFFTPYIVYSNFIMSDVFSGIIALALATLITNVERRKRIESLLIYAFTAAMHYTGLVTGAFLAFFSSLGFAKKIDLKIKIGLVALPILLVALTNLALAKKFKLTEMHQVYLFSQLSSLGVMHTYLEDLCLNEPNHLCLNQDLNFNMWDDSPESRVGLAGGWPVLLPEMAKANHEILNGPLLVPALKLASFRVLDQLIEFYRPLEPIVPSEKNIGPTLSRYSTTEYERSREQRIKYVDIHELIEFVGELHFIVISVAFCILCFQFFRRQLDSKIHSAFLFATAAYFFNALACGLLTDPTHRYGARFAWVFPLLLALEWCAKYSAQPAAHENRPTVAH